MLFSQHLNVHDVNVLFETEYKLILDQLSMDYEQFFIEKPESPIDIEFRVLRAPPQQMKERKFFSMNLRDFCYIDKDRIVMWGKNFELANAYDEEVRPYFTASISAKQIEKNETFLIHASAVRTFNKGVIFVGKKGCGKSSLALRCILNGAEYLSNELVFVKKHHEQACIMGLPQTMTLGIGAARWFRAKWPKVISNSFVKPYRHSDSLSLFSLEIGEKLQVPPKALIQHDSSSLVSKLDAIIFPEANFYSSKPRILPIPQDISVIRLLSAIISPFKWNFWGSLKFETYMDKLTSLLNWLPESIHSYQFQWCQNHDKNYRCLLEKVFQ